MTPHPAPNPGSGELGPTEAASVGPDAPPGAVALALALSRGPGCGRSAVVLVDGPAGSGKTTLAGALEKEAAKTGVSAAVVHMDDLYAGWSGLREGGSALTALLSELAAGGAASYRRYDWVADDYAESVAVPSVEVLIVEGVGCARSEHLHLATVLVWVEEPDAAERLRRGLERDGEAARAHWERWMDEEIALFGEVGTRERADIRVDGVGRLVKAA